MARQLFLACNDWLRHLPPDSRLVEAVEPALPAEGSLIDHLADVRTQIAAAIVDRDQLERSVPPGDDLRKSVERYVRERATTPKVEALLDGGLRIDFTPGL